LIVSEFLHVATDERRFSPPLTMLEALEWIEEFLANPFVQLLEPTQGGSLEQSFRGMRQFNLGRKRILDTQLVAILHTHGVGRLMTSNSADFCIFGALEIVTP
jgi:predicted nucleic acid-binding protein